MSTPPRIPESPLEHFRALGTHLGCELFVKRDDLLPFPLPGNKSRKLTAELGLGAARRAEVLITNGAAGSNHCRTLALLAARSGRRCHLVLHDEGAPYGPALRMLAALGACWEIVAPELFAETLHTAEEGYAERGLRTHVIAGGCHTPAGAQAYRRSAEALLAELRPDTVFVASGTGATQGGIAAAAEAVGAAAEAATGERGGVRPQVIGISVARTAERGRAAVSEAARWAGGSGDSIVFDDRFRAGGYGMSDARTEEAVGLGWFHGLPLDATYTGKAFAALLDRCAQRRAEQPDAPAERILFWHTGGLMNYLAEQEQS